MQISHLNINRFIQQHYHQFIIPDFQRSYSWKQDNVEAFLDDVHDSMKNKRKHFFGSVVYAGSHSESTIIDGQQRLTTILLMITAIYHLLQKYPNDNLSSRSASDINRDFLCNIAERGGGIRIASN